MDARTTGSYDPRTFKGLTFHDATQRFRDGSDSPRAYLELCLETISAREPVAVMSMVRLAGLRAANPRLMLVAAVRGAQIAVVRALLRSGINDVIELPLRAHDLTAILDDLRSRIAASRQDEVKTGQLVSII